MSQVIDALRSVRSFLNDDEALTWSDAVLMPKLKEAHRELVLELALNSIAVVTNQTSPAITVAAGSVTLGTNQPSNIIEPISMMERDVGGADDSYISMIESKFLPTVLPSTDLTYWCWMNEIIKFVGSVKDHEVILRYTGSIATPSKNTDPLGVIFAELYLGPRVAALSKESRGQDSRRLNDLAQSNLEKIIQKNVTGGQRPVRRIGYGRSTVPYLRGVTRPLSVSGGVIADMPLTFISPAETPNGVVTDFTFAQTPKQLIYNGQWRFVGFGYTLVGLVATLIDELGAIITPITGDHLVARV